MPVSVLTAQKPTIKVARSEGASDSITLQLAKDFSGRTPDAKDIKISWELTPDGYKGTYTVSNLIYMTWYDRMGNYKETLLQTAWDDRVPNILKMEFGSSEFNTCSVLTYWERINADHPDYFLEVEDRDGKTLYIWADENGNFSKVPVFRR
jgi:hypothetical protein